MLPRATAAFGLAVTLLVGCSMTPPKKPDPVDVTITVSLPNGQPARGVTLNLLPTTTNQMQSGGKTDAAGKVKAKAMPGKHTFSLEGSGSAIQAVPTKYQQNDAANTLDVPSGGGDIAIKLSS